MAGAQTNRDSNPPHQTEAQPNKKGKREKQSPTKKDECEAGGAPEKRPPNELSAADNAKCNGVNYKPPPSTYETPQHDLRHRGRKEASASSGG